MLFGQLRLVVERFKMRRAASHRQPNHPFGLGSMVQNAKDAGPQFSRILFGRNGCRQLGMIQRRDGETCAGGYYWREFVVASWLDAGAEVRELESEI
jgi:hypothetical protein